MARHVVKRSEELAKRIRGMAAVGVPQEDIAKTVGLGESKLAELYSEELKTAAIEATANVAGMLYKQCLEGNTTAMIFWLKTRGKWRETADVEVKLKSLPASIDEFV